MVSPDFGQTLSSAQGDRFLYYPRFPLQYLHHVLAYAFLKFSGFGVELCKLFVEFFEFFGKIKPIVFGLFYADVPAGIQAITLRLDFFDGQALR